MDISTHVHPREDYSRLLALLYPFLPNSLPIYRSLQFPHHYPDTFVISTFAADAETLEGCDFAIILYEFRGESLSSGAIFSSIQLQNIKSTCHAEDQIFAVFSKLRTLKPKNESDVVFMHMTHSKIGDFLRDWSVVRDDIRKFPVAGKYAYRTKDLSARVRLQGGPGSLEKFIVEMNPILPEGLEFSFIRERDVPRVLKTNAVVKSREGLVGLPNVFIREKGSGRAVCWLFCTRQGSMGISHCEEEYRRRKLASFTGNFLSQAGFMNFSKPFPFALKPNEDDPRASTFTKEDYLEFYSGDTGTVKERIANEWVHQDAFHENAAASNFMKNVPIKWIQNSYWILVDLGRVDDMISTRARQRTRL